MSARGPSNQRRKRRDTSIDIESNRVIISSNSCSTKHAPATVALGRRAQSLKPETGEGETSVYLWVKL